MLLNCEEIYVVFFEIYVCNLQIIEWFICFSLNQCWAKIILEAEYGSCKKEISGRTINPLSPVFETSLPPGHMEDHCAPWPSLIPQSAMTAKTKSNIKSLPEQLLKMLGNSVTFVCTELFVLNRVFLEFLKKHFLHKCILLSPFFLKIWASYLSMTPQVVHYTVVLKNVVIQTKSSDLIRTLMFVFAFFKLFFV